MTEVRALLAPLRNNQAAERPMTARYLCIVQSVLTRAGMHLTILAPKFGDQELIKSVAAGVAKVRSLREAHQQR